jgi:diaminopimelate decarboxylase
MSQAKYERPLIVQSPVGLRHKAGRSVTTSDEHEIDSVPVAALCRRFGSPLFVFSERRIRARVREAKAAFAASYPNTQLCWSYKTNYLDGISAIFHQEGSFAEVVSGMEYEKARRLGVPGDKIVFNGPAKTHAELTRAVRERAVVHADHLEELTLLEQIASELDTRPVVGVRIALDAGIYPRWDRFGFGLENGQALEAVRRIVTGGKLSLGGFHCHIGTFILDPGAYARAATKLLEFTREVQAAFAVRPTHLDLGGGFPSNNTLLGQYHSGSTVPTIGEFAAEIGRALTAGSEGPPIRLLIETGRALIDDAGTLISTVLASKRLSTGKRAIVIDAGVNLLFTAWWYRLGITSSRPAAMLNEETIVYGPLCMNIDCVRESVPLPDLQAGDTVCIHPVGAYCFTQSMQFIHLRPACVLIDRDGMPELIRRAEVLEDLTGPEILPERLKGPYFAAVNDGPHSTKLQASAE